MSERRILDADERRRALTRIAQGIVERNGGTDDLVLVGVRSRGVPLARRLAGLIEQHEGVSLPVGALDISFYRDDLTKVAHAPIVKKTQAMPDLAGRPLVLVAAVPFTGRPARAALSALAHPGPPRAVRRVPPPHPARREHPAHELPESVRSAAELQQV